MVTAAIAESSTSELGHGVVGSWLPGSAYSRGLAISPFTFAAGPSTMCSLIITESNPASSASRAQRTSRGRSRPQVMVQFSLRIRHILGAAIERPLLGRHRGSRGRPPGLALAPGRADAAKFPVPAKSRGPDFLAFRRLRAQVTGHRQRPGHDVVAQPAQPLHVDLDDVPRLHRA